MGADPTKTEIVELFASCQLASFLAQGEGGYAPEAQALSEIESRCIELHQERRINLLALTNTEELSSLDSFRFFSFAHAIGRLIPSLTCPVNEVMEATERMVARGGNDGAAYEPNRALLKWLEQNPSEARAAIASARDGQLLASRNVTFALQALKDAGEARGMAKDFKDDRRLAALMALSRIEEVERAGYEQSILVFEELIAQGVDARAKAQILHASAWMFERMGEVAKRSASNIICRVAESGDGQIRFAAACVIWMNKDLIHSEALEPLIELLLSTQATEIGTIGQIDSAIRALNGAGENRRAINLVTNLVKASDGSISLKQFPAFVTTLSASGEVLAEVTIAWLLSGHISLCKELLWHFQHSSEPKGNVINIPAEFVPTNDLDREFVARKAVGWLIFTPVTAASILMSILRVCDGICAKNITSLLDELLLANYMSVHDYLKTCSEAESLQVRLDALLAANQVYLDGFGFVPHLPDLRPPDAHRRIQQMRRAEQARDASKSAHKQSVFFSMVKRSVILHGAGALVSV